MRTHRTVLVVAVLLAGLPVGVGAQQPTCDGNFHVVHPLGSIELNDVDFASPNNGWAVGFDYEKEEVSDERPLVVRFDNNDVERVTPPYDKERRYELQAVAAISPTDVYAVGYSYRGSRRSRAVVFHWDGSTWTDVDVPSPGRLTWLRSIHAVSADDIWVAGDFQRRYRRGAETLFLHYDGTQWSRVPSPSPGKHAGLVDLDALASDEVWAVGYTTRTSPRFRHRPLALRWDGTEWKRRLARVEFRNFEEFLGLDLVTSDDMWIVGVGTRRDLILHFDGSEWSFHDFPDTRGWERFNGVAATAIETWVVGHRFVLSPYETAIPLAGYRSGGEWRRSSFAGDRYGDVEDVVLDGTGDAWAIGETFDPEGDDLGDVIEKACLP